MKKIILIASSIVLISFVTNAQETANTKAKTTLNQKAPAETRAKKQVEELNQIVGLTDDQKTKVYVLALNKAKKIDSVTEKYKNDPEGNNKSYAEMDAIKKDYRKSVKAILTPEQIEKFKAAKGVE